MAGLILNYEKDLDEYASAWVNVKRQKEKAENEDMEKAFIRPFSPASGTSPQSLKNHMMNDTMQYQEGLSPIGAEAFADPLQ